ncbi:TPA: class I SAM-dependent methyltransferase [Pseudomonas aeruginosa]|nr:class I SAM-dependent methyltransferase [Pseudomonas aeruginosa]
MPLFKLEHSKLVHRTDIAFYVVGVLVLAVWLGLFCPAELRLECLLLAALGLVAWSLLEYLLHRFVLHGLSPFRQWHQSHHQRPGALIGLSTLSSAALFIGLVYLPALLALGPWRGSSLALGIMSGYLAYILTHHAVHHFDHSGNAWLARRQLCHHLHHSALWQAGHFGVTSAFWDRLFASDRLPPRTASGKWRNVAEITTRHARSLSARKSSKLLGQLFRGTSSRMNARLWDGTLLQLGPTAGTQAPFTLVYRHADGVQKMILSNSDPQRLAEAYFRDDFDIEGDLFAALALREHMQTQRKVWHRRARLLFGAIMLPSSVTTESDRQKGFLRQQITTGMHSDAEKPDATTFRYDLSNAFYGLWLDPAMVYSCGYFEQIDDSLEQAQRAKLELICRKLQLHPGEHLLDIGCGWGALILHAAQYHRVHAHGITLSREQLALARERIDAAGLQALVTVECCDYRDLKGQQVYDKIASVGLSEHLGPDNLPLFFDTVHRLLKDSGLFLNQGITQCPDGGQRTASARLINRYLFTDGQPDTLGSLVRRMEQAQLEVTDVESLRRHYGLTLRLWVSRLEQRQGLAVEYVGEPTYRAWRLLMAASALVFEAGELGVFQIVTSRHNGAPSSLPLTRHPLYRDDCSIQRLSEAVDATPSAHPPRANADRPGRSRPCSVPRK